MTAVLVETLLGTLAVAVAVPSTVLLLEVLASFCGRDRDGRGEDRGDGTRPRAAVLIPAHDEAAGIGRTLLFVQAATGPDDRVLVVADNCTDETAEVARQLGAEVVERCDDVRRGKGYALQYGAEHLARVGPRPDVLVVVDADCEVNATGVAALARTAVESGRPVQSLNLTEDDPNPGPLQAVAALAFRFKNLVRTLGASRLGWPCHLMGTGMALPWELAQRVSFGGDHLTEDMQLGVELAIEGRPAVFEPEALVTSPLPTKNSAFVSQRTRWEQGHLQTAWSTAPKLLWAGLTTGRPSLLGFAADLCVPPLSLLVTTWLATATLTGAAALLGVPAWPFLLACGTGACLGLAILLGWLVHCRRVVPWRVFVLVPWFVLRKIPIYASLPFRGPTRWVRTARDERPAPAELELGERT